MQSYKLNAKKAFTLVELLVVMVIVGILIGLAVFGLSAAQKSARDTNRKNDLRNIVNAMETYAVKNGGSYPAGATISGSKFSVTPATGDVTVDDVELKSVKPTLNTSSTSGCKVASNTDSRTTYIALVFSSGGFEACVGLENDPNGLFDSRK